MRLLIVNPNTSAGVTRNIDAAAQAVARPEDVFKTVSAAFGPELIVTEADGAEAAEGVLASVKAHGADVDGVVLASFGDTGKEAVRRAYPDLPVIGIASAAYATVRCLGGRFSVVTFDPSLVASLAVSIRQHGLTDMLSRIEAADGPGPLDAATVQADRFDQMAALCDTCTRDDISCIVLGGGPLAGLSRRIQTGRRVAIIDGTQAAIGLLRASRGAST